ncbi:MAG: hypothetical protein ACXWR0_17710 [Bdellovibrio sp.]
MRKQKFNQFRSMIVFIFLFLCTYEAFASGTVVGNGGDPIFEFMRATKDSMVETIKSVLNEEAERKVFCSSAHLNEKQIDFCRDFFISIAPQILRLGQGEQQVQFVLRDEPLHVTGPDGKPMIVSARTNLGPEGPIEIHRDSVKIMPPQNVLFLITHEFEHKTVFNNHFIADNEKIGPFLSGRELLDTVASALVAVAKRKGKVGAQFGIRDIFQCTAASNDAQFGAQILSSRLFQSEDLMSYETSVGRNPLDGSIFFRENLNTVIRLKFTIFEPNNCGDITPKRHTTVQIVRTTRLESGQITEEVLVEKIVSQNPICSQDMGPLQIAHQNIRFECKYFGSEGTTASPVALSNIQFY